MKCENEIDGNCIETLGRCTDCGPFSASDCYARPRTRGELAKLLKSGVSCEVVSTSATLTKSMLIGWLGFEDVTVKPSHNPGWSIFSAIGG